MKDKLKHTTPQGSADLRIVNDSVIVCVLKGYITEDIAKKVIAETRVHAAELNRQGKPASLLVDVAAVIGQTSGARTQAKTIGKIKLEKIAISGPSPALGMIVQYLIRAGGMAGYARVFRRSKQALEWLMRRDKSSPKPFFNLRVIVAMTVGVLASAALIGWVINSDVLKSLFPSFKAMNPVVVILLVAFAVAIALIKPGGGGGKFRRAFITTASVSAIIFGVLIILRALFGFDTAIDRWLFTERLNLGNLSGNAAPRAAANFMLVGLMLLAVLTGQRKKWQQYTFHAASVLVFLSTVSSIVDYGYGASAFLGAVNFLPMPLNTAICFLLINHALQTVCRPTRFFDRAMRQFTKYSLAIIVFAAILLIAGIGWQQSRLDIQHNAESKVRQEFSTTAFAMNERIAAYINALRGYRSFFEASDFVDPSEYHTYFAASKLQSNYPGFTSIVFVSNVPAAQKNAFIAQMQALASNEFPKFKAFDIRPANSNPVLYPVVYAEPRTASTSYGLDLGFDDTRRRVLESARENGDIAVSGTINLNASMAGNVQKRPGFFMTIPVYSKTKELGEPLTVQARQARILGYVNAYFEDRILFGDIFKDHSQLDVRYVISDARTGEVVYTHNPDAKDIQKDVKYQDLVQVAGENLKLTMYTTADYGVEGFGEFVPILVVSGGVILGLLASSLMIFQARRRDEALALASSMTEDLNSERSAAIAVQQKDEAILSSIGDAVFAIDTKKRITLFNQSAERISGYPADEALGKPYEDVLRFVFEKDGVTVNNGFITSALNGHLSSMKDHTQLICKDGSKVSVADSAAPIRDAKGVLLGAIIVFRDVTKEQQLDKAKTEFVSLASHQLRTPLSAIGWYSEMLLTGDVGKLTKAQQEQVQEIHDGNARMVELVNALLDASRLELDKLNNQPAPTSIIETFRSLEHELASTIESKAIKLTAQLEPKIPLINVDPKLLRMIVQNLLSNAVKYTPEKGHVQVTIRTARASDVANAHLSPNKSYLYFEVADTGYGIPKAQQNKIFEKMFRADNVLSLPVEGTGLGLYIVKQVAEKLGGRVWFVSIEGKGTTFYVILPFSAKRQPN